MRANAILGLCSRSRLEGHASGSEQGRAWTPEQDPIRYEEMNVMDGASPRWHGQRSVFPWEEDALQYLKAKVPDAEPYRAWQTFKFTSGNGHVREMDLLLA